jgi:hypothetical protein
MAEWLEDYVAAIDPLNSTLCFMNRTWLNWRPSGALRWKVETTGWDGQVVVCDELAPPRL